MLKFHLKKFVLIFYTTLLLGPNLFASDDLYEVGVPTFSFVVSRISNIEEVGAGTRFFLHLLTDPVEISRQVAENTSQAWQFTADALRVGTIGHNIYHLCIEPNEVTPERIFELLHYVGDAGERFATYIGYAGEMRTFMNVLQVGGVAGYLTTRAYKRFFGL